MLYTHTYIHTYNTRTHIRTHLGEHTNTCMHSICKKYIHTYIHTGTQYCIHIHMIVWCKYSLRQIHSQHTHIVWFLFAHVESSTHPLARSCIRPARCDKRSAEHLRRASARGIWKRFAEPHFKRERWAAQIFTHSVYSCFPPISYARLLAESISLYYHSSFLQWRIWGAKFTFHFIESLRA